MIEMLLRSCCTSLGLIETKELDLHVRKCEESAERAEGFGCIIDPTAWIAASSDGTFQDAKNQLEIARHLLAARRAMDAREAFCNSLRSKCDSNKIAHADRQRLVPGD